MNPMPLETAAVPRLVRLRAMGRLGLRMMFHDRLKFIGTISGVVFAVLLAVQQLSILFALLNRNTQFVDNAGADIFIVPPNTRLLQPGEKLHEVLLSAEEARRAADLGELMVIWPEYAFHQGGERPAGKPLPDGFVYSSDHADPRLGVEETRWLLEHVA